MSTHTSIIYISKWSVITDLVTFVFECELYTKLFVCLFVFKHTPLMIACIRGNVDVVMVLLKYGASVTLTDEKSYNALDLAIEEGKWYES